MGFNERFEDTRACCSRFWGSSFVRQFLFTIVPMFITTIVIVNLNYSNVREHQFVSSTITVSSTAAIAEMANTFFLSQLTSASMITESISNRLLVDPYQPSGLMSLALPGFASNDAAKYFGITHSDAAQSYMVVADGATTFTLQGRIRGAMFAANVLEVADTGAIKYTPTSGIPDYATAFAPQWMTDAAPRTLNLPWWIPPNSTTSNDEYWLPSLAVTTFLGLRVYDVKAVTYVRATVKLDPFMAAASSLPSGVLAYVIDATPQVSRVYAAFSAAEIGLTYFDLPALRAYIQQGTLLQLFSAQTTVATLGNSTLIISPLTIEYGMFVLLTVGVGNSMASHMAAMSTLPAVFDPVLAVIRSSMYVATAGLLRDLEDAVHVATVIAPVYAPQAASVSTVTFASALQFAVYRFTRNPTVKSSTVCTVLWPPSRTINRVYSLANSLPSTTWVEQATPVDGNISAVLASTHDSRSAAPTLITTALPWATLMHLTVCVQWPLLVQPSANQSCVHNLFGLDVLNTSLVGMNLHTIGTAVIALTDGTVLGAGGDSIPMSPTIVGRKIWEIVPQWNQALTLLLNPTNNGLPVAQNGKQFLLTKLARTQSSIPGANIVVISIISDTVSSSNLRTAVLAAVDFLAFFVVLVFFVHAVHFVKHMYTMRRVADIVNMAAELETDCVPTDDPMLRTTCYNKDIESMLVSAVTLFVHMKRIKGCLPDYILMRHRTEHVVVATSAASQTAPPAAATQSAANINTVSTPAIVKDAQSATTLVKREVLMVAVVAPQSSFAYPTANADVATVTKIVGANRGCMWIADRRAALIAYWASDQTAAGFSAMRALARALPTYCVVSCRSEATYGVIGTENVKSFMMAGPAVDLIGNMIAAVRDVWTTTPPQLTPDEMEARLCAPILIDDRTLMKVDSTSIVGCVARTVGMLSTSAGSGIDVETRAADLLTTVTSGADRVIVRELFDTDVHDVLTIEAPRLLWSGVGDACTAILEQRAPDAKSLMDTVESHLGSHPGYTVPNSAWDRAVTALIRRHS